MATYAIDIIDESEIKLEVVASIAFLMAIYQTDTFIVNRLDPALYNGKVYFHVDALGTSMIPGESLTTYGRTDQAGLIRDVYEFVKRDFFLDADLKASTVFNVINEIATDVPSHNSLALQSVIDGYNNDPDPQVAFDNAVTYLKTKIDEAIDTTTDIKTDAEVQARLKAIADAIAYNESLPTDPAPAPEDYVTVPDALPLYPYVAPSASIIIGLYDIGYYDDDFETHLTFNRPEGFDPDVIIGIVRQTGMFKAIGFNGKYKGLYIISNKQSTVIEQLYKL